MDVKVPKLGKIFYRSWSQRFLLFFFFFFFFLFSRKGARGRELMLMRAGSAINGMVVMYVRNRPNVVNERTRKHPEDRSAKLLVDSCSPLPPGRRHTVHFSDASRPSPTRRRLVGRRLSKPFSLTRSSSITIGQCHDCEGR
ncbi:uncharacterized protein LY79DRAFT_334221 [Colletotrichum navitas]|uniref:Uncharacterized protein n=1 Tax=Colletotrichum navitas TaxID=681940 RepID=A0AAD8PTJ3_9PEZI|nr:uncharacterized protein LY79DRAFT_334221 [Colletotrichum navitas]KAK1579752.1 hypothetical protein LY79DRAFT_334221 [Colletotrichum navitas]